MDFVITWVDGNDPEWQREKAKYSGKKDGDDRIKRYREWDLLKYWFRGVEKCAPWVGHVYFITCGHLPSWLNLDHPKLRVIKHSDYIPEKYLPTFSSRPIDLNFHRIPDLSEEFVYFNDDMFLLKSVTEKDFFQKGKPCDAAICQIAYLRGEDANGTPLRPENYNTSNVYNLPPINRNFRKNRSIRKNFFKWFNLKYGKKMFRTFCLLPWNAFTGFMNPHLPYSYHKSTYREAWEKEEMILDRACQHKFREGTDVNNRMLCFWQIAKGDFYPRSFNIGKYYAIQNDQNKNAAMYQAITGRKYKFVCLNDEYTGNDFETVKAQLQECFEQVFPDKSGFEL